MIALVVNVCIQEGHWKQEAHLLGDKHHNIRHNIAFTSSLLSILILLEFGVNGWDVFETVLTVLGVHLRINHQMFC